MPPCAPSSWSWSGGNAAALTRLPRRPGLARLRQDGSLQTGKLLLLLLHMDDRCSYQADCGAVFRLPFRLIRCLDPCGASNAVILFVLWLLFHAAGGLVNLIWIAIIVLVALWLFEI